MNEYTFIETNDLKWIILKEDFVLYHHDDVYFLCYIINNL